MVGRVEIGRMQRKFHTKEVLDKVDRELTFRVEEEVVFMEEVVVMDTQARVVLEQHTIIMVKEQVGLDTLVQE